MFKIDNWYSCILNYFQCPPPPLPSSQHYRKGAFPVLGNLGVVGYAQTRVVISDVTFSWWISEYHHEKNQGHLSIAACDIDFPRILESYWVRVFSPISISAVKQNFPRHCVCTELKRIVRFFILAYSTKKKWNLRKTQENFILGWLWALFIHFWINKSFSVKPTYVPFFFFPHWQSKNPAIFLNESILAYNLWSKIFPDTAFA